MTESHTIDTLDVDDAQELAWGESFDSMEFVACQEVSKHRWYTACLVVFRDAEGGLFGFRYLDPATEMQDGQDRFESDPVKVFPVVATEITRTVYEAQS